MSCAAAVSVASAAASVACVMVAAAESSSLEPDAQAVTPISTAARTNNGIRNLFAFIFDLPMLFDAVHFMN